MVKKKIVGIKYFCRGKSSTRKYKGTRLGKVFIYRRCGELGENNNITVGIILQKKHYPLSKND